MGFTQPPKWCLQWTRLSKGAGFELASRNTKGSPAGRERAGTGAMGPAIATARAVTVSTRTNC